MMMQFSRVRDMTTIFDLYDAILATQRVVRIIEIRLTNISDTCDVKDAEVELITAKKTHIEAKQDAMQHFDYDPRDLGEYLAHNCDCGRCSECFQAYDDYIRDL
jgi:hypothetical protein